MQFAFIQSFNAEQIFLFCMCLLVFSLLLHNKFKSWWIGSFLILTYIAVSYFFITSIQEWWLFIFGTIAYGVIDTLSVYFHLWKYNTTHGYALWAGPAWGILTILIHHIVLDATWPFIIFLLILASIFIYSRKSREFNFSHFEIFKILLIVACGVLLPKIFLISFGMGVLIEFFSVEYFHTWKYPDPSYLQLGFEYGMLICSIEIVFGFILGNHSPYLICLSCGMFGYFLLHYATRSNAKQFKQNLALEMSAMKKFVKR
jgi:hypothetical protein